MRSFAAAVLALGLATLAGSAVAQTTPPAAAAANRTFQANYALFGRGMEVGDFTYRFTQTGNSYEASANREMKGWVGAALNRSQDYRYSVRGNVAADGSLHPSAYEHQGGRRRDDRPNGRLVRAAFTASDVVTTVSPGRPNMGSPPATAAQRRGVIDQITAIAALLTPTSADPCDRTLHVYMDGRARFDFIMTPNGRVTVNSPAYQGPGYRCRVQFRPLAGFGDPQEASVLTFVFAEQRNGLYAPVTIEMPTDGNGIARLEARRLTLNGTRLR